MVFPNGSGFCAESVLEEEEVHVPATPKQEPPVSTAPARLAGA